jgi:hypothetical protein
MSRQGPRSSRADAGTATRAARLPGVDALGYAVLPGRVDLFRRLFVVKLAVITVLDLLLDALLGQQVPLLQRGPADVASAAFASLMPLACATANGTEVGSNVLLFSSSQPRLPDPDLRA